jgi:hypothetical protein
VAAFEAKWFYILWRFFKGLERVFLTKGGKRTGLK